jgi:hypothetical protein
MKLVSPKLCLVLAGAAFVFAGCSKKPDRPNPGSTVLGQQIENTPAPTNLSTVSDLNTGLVARDDFDPLTGQNRVALQGSTVYFEFDQSSIKLREREQHPPGCLHPLFHHVEIEALVRGVRLSSGRKSPIMTNRARYA